jgi:Domain of unknown function (DUF4349)
MATIHDEIDNWLAADVHDQLSETEREAFHSHLIECATCRRLHQENKIMNKVLDDMLTAEKPDPTFEQRMLSNFRRKVPHRTSIVVLVANLIRLRATQITAVAALLLALVQVGRMLTHEGSQAQAERLVVTGSNIPRAEEAAPNEGDTETKKDNLESATPTAQLADNGRTTVPGGGIFDGLRTDDKQKALQAPLKTRGAAKPADVGAVAKSAPAAPDLSAAEKVEQAPAVSAVSQDARKLVRNAQVELEVTTFEDVVQRITDLATQEKGYVATSGSQKQANGKLKGQIVVKVLPENLDHFLQSVRGLGELKHQTIGTEDVTKTYFDTDSRLKNARVMEQRLIDMLKTKTGKVSDLLQVEKELGRVREDIEKMQGELKHMDALVQFATVTISLTEKDMEEPAAYLLKERAQLALFTPDVEKIFNDIKSLTSPKTQITSAQLDRDNTGRVSAHVTVLIAPEESDAQIERVKRMGRVQNFQVQTERIAQGGNGLSENAKTKRDKVELNINISREEQEQSVQQTSLRIRTSAVDEKTKELRAAAEKQSGRVSSSSFSRDPDGREFANVSLRVPMRNYSALMQSLHLLGKVENVAVQRQDRTGQIIDEANAPVDISIQVYSQGNIVPRDTGLLATLRRTLAQGAGALMWSLRMIGVAIAFLAPWAIALAVVIWIGSRIVRARQQKD